MKAEEWKKEHKYNNYRNCCGNCFHVKDVSDDPFAQKWECAKMKEETKAGIVKPSYSCDLWRKE
jgi:hypothetical protein